jgi:hypothetical protein
MSNIKKNGWFLFSNGRFTNLELQLCFPSIWIEPTRLILGPSPSVRISSGGRNQCTNDWQKGVLANHIYLLNGGLVHKGCCLQHLTTNHYCMDLIYLSNTVTPRTIFFCALERVIHFALLIWNCGKGATTVCRHASMSGVTIMILVSSILKMQRAWLNEENITLWFISTPCKNMVEEEWNLFHLPGRENSIASHAMWPLPDILVPSSFRLEGLQQFDLGHWQYLVFGEPHNQGRHTVTCIQLRQARSFMLPCCGSSSGTTLAVSRPSTTVRVKHPRPCLVPCQTLNKYWYPRS